MSAISIVPGIHEQAWNLPSRGRVGMYCLIIGESAIFTIFVVAYIFYIGKSLYGPTPQQVLDVPIFNTICLLSSSVTIWLAERAIERDSIRSFWTLVGGHHCPWPHLSGLAQASSGTGSFIMTA